MKTPIQSRQLLLAKQSLTHGITVPKNLTEQFALQRVISPCNWYLPTGLQKCRAAWSTQFCSSWESQQINSFLFFTALSESSYFLKSCIVNSFRVLKRTFKFPDRTLYLLSPSCIIFRSCAFLVSTSLYFACCKD